MVGNKEKEIWPDLKYPFEFSNYCLLLINDDVHSYPDVIAMVKHALTAAKCSDRDAMELTKDTDKNGRTMIKVGSFKECAKARDRMDRRSRGKDVQPLNSIILPTYIYAHQNFALRIITWLVLKLSDEVQDNIL